MQRESSGVLVVVAVGSLAWGCQVVAPLRPLPNADSGSDGETDGPPDAGDGPDAPGADAAGVDAGAGAGDAGAGDAAAGDGGADNRSIICDPSMRFGQGILVAGINPQPEAANRVRLSPDELTAYLGIGNPWNVASDLYWVKRASRIQPFGALVPFTELNGDSGQVAISVTGDGLTAIFDDMSTGVGRIRVATRPSGEVPFGPPAALPLYEGSASEWDPYVLPDGSALYFLAVESTSRTGVYRATLHGTTAEQPSFLPLPSGAAFPVISDDELVLYVGMYDARVRSDIWMATRSSADEPFSSLRSLTELNTPEGDEIPQWISPDGCRLYFGRGASGSNFWYLAERGRE